MSVFGLVWSLLYAHHMKENMYIICIIHNTALHITICN